MGRDFNGTSDQAETGSTPVTATPVTIACWFNADAFPAFSSALCGVSNGVNSRVTLAFRATGALRAQAGQNDGAAASAQTTNTVSTGVWAHAAGVFASDSSRIAYLDGTASTENTTALVPAAFDRITAGFGYIESGSDRSDAKVAEVAVWNVALTAAEIAALAKGFSPWLVRPQSLRFYAPMIGRYSPEIDIIGARGLTLTGTAVADHPRVFQPARLVALDKFVVAAGRIHKLGLLGVS